MGGDDQVHLWRQAPENEHGYVTAFWAIFLGTVMVPLMVLAWDVGRLFYARGEIQKAADAAALAAAREEVIEPGYDGF